MQTIILTKKHFDKNGVFEAADAVREFANEVTDLHYDPVETELVCNKLLSERKIKAI